MDRPVNYGKISGTPNGFVMLDGSFFGCYVVRWVVLWILYGMMGRFKALQKRLGGKGEGEGGMIVRGINTLISFVLVSVDINIGSRVI